MPTPNAVTSQLTLTRADIDFLLARAYLRAEMTAALIGPGSDLLAARLAGQVSALYRADLGCCAAGGQPGCGFCRPGIA